MSDLPTIHGRPMYWRLDGHQPVPATREQFGAQFERPEVRRVAYDEIGEANVSTVFLGLDHNYGDGPPLLFETMVFGLPGETEYQWRYATWDEAVAGHERAVVAVREGREP